MSMKLFQIYGSPAWPGDQSTSLPFAQNATWNESTDINSSTLFTVPNTIRYQDNSFEFSNKFVQSAFRPGALPVSSILDRRPITIEGEVFMDTRSELEALERDFKRAAIRPHLKLGLDDEKYINLAALKDFKWIYRKASGRTFAFVKITWEAADPFWYRWNRQEQVENIDITDEPFDPGSASFTVTVDATLATWPIYAWFQMEAPVSPSDTIYAPITIGNNTDQSAEMQYLADIGPGHTVQINCEAGTVGGSLGNVIQNFSGQFIRLLPGNNSLYFYDDSATQTGSQILNFDMTIRWRERWL